MPSFDASTTSAAPPEEVWKILYDPSRLPEWWVGIENFPMPQRLQASSHEQRVVISCLVSDLRFQWSLEPVDDGAATRISVHVDIPDEEAHRLGRQHEVITASLRRLAELADAAASVRAVEIRGPRLLLRAIAPDEIEAEWRAMVDADPMTIADLPDEAGFKARLRRSGQLHSGWLDLAVDLGGESIGRIQTFVPPGRALGPGVFEVGIGLREAARGQGYGREALMLLTDWLFEQAGAERVEAPTDPANTAMRTVFQRAGWELAATLTEFGREWLMYAITRQHWKASRPSLGRASPH